MCRSYSIAIRKPFSKADKNSIIVDTFLYRRRVARMDTCVRFIIAMKFSQRWTCDVPSCQGVKARGSGVPYDFVGEFTIIIQN